MICVPQTILKAPDGNCFAACVASILEASITEVPNFVGEFGTGWYEKFCEWLAPMNMSAMLTEHDENLPELPGYAVLCGNRADGGGHCVVVSEGDVVWNPDPSQGSLLVQRRYYVHFVALDPSKNFHKPPMVREH